MGHPFFCAGLRLGYGGSCYPTQAELGWGTHFLWWVEGARSNRRSFGRCGDLRMTSRSWSLCYPTLAARTKTPRGWGTHVCAGLRVGHGGSCYPTQAELGWGTHFLWWVEGARSNRRSFGRCGDLRMTSRSWSLCYPTLAARTKTPRGWGTHVCAGLRVGHGGSCYPTQAELGWGTHFLWWVEGARSNRRSFGRCGDLRMTSRSWSLWYPTLAARTKTPRGWGTHVCAGLRVAGGDSRSGQRILHINRSASTSTIKFRRGTSFSAA